MKKLYLSLISFVALLMLSSFPIQASSIGHNHYDRTGQAYTHIVTQHQHKKNRSNYKGTEVLRDRILNSLRELGELN